MPRMNRRFLLGAICALAMALAGCAGKPEQTKSYPLKGEVKALDAASKTATIAHEKIGDWMEAMTMEFPVKPDEEFQKLKVGDRIEATVVVGEVKYHVTGVKVVSRAQ
jgi:Cu/Ag efflux protein CusF